jgi:hypothetical protein
MPDGRAKEALGAMLSDLYWLGRVLETLPPDHPLRDRVDAHVRLVQELTLIAGSNSGESAIR